MTLSWSLMTAFQVMSHATCRCWPMIWMRQIVCWWCWSLTCIGRFVVRRIMRCGWSQRGVFGSLVSSASSLIRLKRAQSPGFVCFRSRKCSFQSSPRSPSTIWPRSSTCWFIPTTQCFWSATFHTQVLMSRLEQVFDPFEDWALFQCVDFQQPTN